MNRPEKFRDDIKLASSIAARLVAADITPDDPDFIELMASETDVLDRLRRIIRAARITEAQGKALASIIEEMRGRKARLDKKAEGLRSAAQWALGELGMNKIEAPDFSATISAGKPRVLITDPDILPDWAVRTTVSPDKAKIKDAFESGESVPGAELSNAAPVMTVRGK